TQGDRTVTNPARNARGRVMVRFSADLQTTPDAASEDRLLVQGLDAAAVPYVEAGTVGTDLHEGVLVGDAVFGLEFDVGVIVREHQRQAGLHFVPAAAEIDHGRLAGRAPLRVEIDDRRPLGGKLPELIPGFVADGIRLGRLPG